MEIAMIDDQIVPIDQATIGAHERGVFFGDGVYEVCRSWAGRLFAFDRHLARLERSLREMDMLSLVDLETVRRRVQRAVDAADIENAVVYFHITRGQQYRAHEYDENVRPQFFLTVKANTKVYQPTVAAVTFPDQRWKRCDIKSLNLLPNVMAKQAAVRAAAYEAVLVDDDGLVTEGSSTTVFIASGNQLRTAPLTANILPGITRALILEWAAPLGLQVDETSFRVADILAADEVFISGTISEIRTIVRLDDQVVSGGQPGPVARRLQQKLLAEMKGPPAPADK